MRRGVAGPVATLRGVGWLVVAACVGCVQVTAELPVVARETSSPRTSRLAEVPKVYVYDLRDEVHSSWVPDPYWVPIELPSNGILIAPPRGAPPLEVGDQLAVVHSETEVSIVEVTGDRCPPGSDDCLECGTRWATLVSGPELPAPRSRSADAMTLIGPLRPGIEIGTSTDRAEVDGAGLVVTADGVRLRRLQHCERGVACRDTTELIDGDLVRVVSWWSPPPLDGPRLFELRASPGQRYGALGGDDIAVIGQAQEFPSDPMPNATYWLVGRDRVVGSVRVEAVDEQQWCRFPTDPCWVATPIEFPSPDLEVMFVIGPVPDSAAYPSAWVVTQDDEFRAVIGLATAPWATIEQHWFGCAESGRYTTNGGGCFETFVNANGSTTHELWFVDFHNLGRAQLVCRESESTAIR